MQHEARERDAFRYYLRTGRTRLPSQLEEQKFNPYHDPEDGRFTFAPGGPKIRASSSGTRSGGQIELTRDDPIGEIIRNAPPATRPNPTNSPATTARSSGGALSHWPVAGASTGSLNRADKPGEGNPSYGSNRTRGKHRGIDIKAPEGTIVRSAGAGVVVRIVPNPSGTFGDQIVVYHGNGVFTQYAHLKHRSARVRPGNRVTAGQAIAQVGRTGNTPRLGDSHLHFEVRIGSSAPASAGGHTRDPLEYLPK